MTENLPVPAEEAELGPAMKALTPIHRAFVLAYCTNGCKPVEAARDVGYTDNKTGAIRVTAHRILHKPEVLAAIREWTIASMKANLPVYRDLLDKIAMNDQHKDQAKALLAAMDRAGLPAVIEKNINVTVTMTEAEKVARIKELSAQLGVPVPQIVGNVTDAEFVEVKGDRLEGF